MQTNKERLVEGEGLPPFRICINYEMQDGGFQTLDQAIAAVKGMKRPDKYIQIFHHRKPVWGRPPPKSHRD